MLKTFISSVLLAVLAGCGSNPDRPEHVDSDAVATAARGSGAQSAPEVSPQVQQRYQDALALIRDRNRDAARTLLLEITREQPDLSGPWTNLGRIYLQDGDPDSARKAFERAVATNPGNCAAHSEYGVMLRKLGEFDAALGQYKACLAAQPDHADTYYNLGILYELYLGKLGEALDAYRQYLQLTKNPDKKVEGWIADLERRARS